MFTLILSYLGGVLTIFSPCVLPVVPFVFARSDQPFRKTGLPMLIGMGLSFATFAALSVAGGRWVVQANQIGRTLALIVFTILGLSLVFSRFAERLARPLVQLGGALQKRADAKAGFGSSLILGASIGLLWAPCAGPILGLVLAGASLGESNQKTFALLFVFAMGAATSLGVAIFAGGKVLRVLKRGLGAEEWIKRGLGVLTLGAVAAIALGLDTKILAKFSFVNTNAIEQSLVNHAQGTKSVEKSSPLDDEGPAPSFDGAITWLNSPPLTLESLRGKVVLVDFWTYSCINCLRTLPYLEAWDKKYRSQGLVIVGVHTPEFAFEKDLSNIKKAVTDLGIQYPVAVDSNEVIWAAYKNQIWPAHYFVDANGRIRHHEFGEGGYEESEQVIQELLKEAHGGKTVELPTPTSKTAPMIASSVTGKGVEAAPSVGDIGSPETYLGFERQEGFSSTPQIKEDASERYQEPAQLLLNHWGIAGVWKITAERAFLQSKSGVLSFRFRARDLNLVMGAPVGKAIRYRVTLDGNPPGTDHGEDTDARGNGTVHSNRLYQLIRRAPSNPEQEHTFRIEFLDPEAEVFAFTFG